MSYKTQVLINVRLGKEEEKIVQGLRRAKVNVSALLRKAIRDAAGATRAASSPIRQAEAVLARYPVTEAELGADQVDLTSRVAMKLAIAKRLK